ncbi:hypothetical protein AWB85_13090 [Mycobacteroides immunogenum]|uniref:Uncharacterized protein n=1 Tax=Mycobacteroides immunogenum TaxID=83262 RepID=A0A179V5W5_9MYCO|nr:hypothetical protein [Mycobacteroides immunogenum]OAT67104.1 hypothetical protein AWB85_13090 [Mycobacteroides immunogenum]
MAAETSSSSNTSDAEFISPAGKVYQLMVASLLATEFDRKKTLEARGAVLVTSSVSLLTLVSGVMVLLVGKDYVFRDHCSFMILLGALLAFIASAVCAIFVQTYGFGYTVMDRATLKNLENNSNWSRTADDAARNWVHWQVISICSLRESNGIKANLVVCGLALQVLAIILLSGSLGLELSSKF